MVEIVCQEYGSSANQPDTIEQTECFTEFNPVHRFISNVGGKHHFNDLCKGVNLSLQFQPCNNMKKVDIIFIPINLDIVISLKHGKTVEQGFQGINILGIPVNHNIIPS